MESTKHYFLRVIIASLVILVLFGAVVFGLAGVFYNDEWRTEQMRLQDRYERALQIDQERMLLSDQVAKMEKSQSFSKSEIEAIIRSFIISSYPESKDVPPANLAALYWTYPNSLWYVTCLLMSMEPLPMMNVTSAVTHPFSMNLKIVGPTISVVTIASMAAAINWLFCKMLYFVAHKPENLPDCLTAEYQRKLLLRDTLVMLLTICLFVATFVLAAPFSTENGVIFEYCMPTPISLVIIAVCLYSAQVKTGSGAALCGVLSFLSLTATFGESFDNQAKTSIMQMLFWMSLLLILQSSLAACLTATVRAYRTWLTSKDVVATPAELRAYLEKERVQKRNQLIYHAKAE